MSVLLMRWDWADAYTIPLSDLSILLPYRNFYYDLLLSLLSLRLVRFRAL
jgi:hypothetical protein